MTQQQEVKIVALKTLPYYKIRLPNEVFMARQGYADFFIRQGLARLATPDDEKDERSESVVQTTRALITRKPRKSKKS